MHASNLRTRAHLRRIALSLVHARLFEFLRKKKTAAAREGVLAVIKAEPSYFPAVLLAGAVELSLNAHEQAQLHLSRVLERVRRGIWLRERCWLHH